MVLDGNDSIKLIEAQRESQRTIGKLVQENTLLKGRVERLETLEFEKATIGNGDGCVTLGDSELGGATISVVAPVDSRPNVDIWQSQKILFWSLRSTDNVNIDTLNLRINNKATAHYNYTYKYARGAAQTIISADLQTSIICGRIPGANEDANNYGKGWVIVPHYSSVNHYPAGYGSWTAYDSSQSLNSRMEKGEWGGNTVYYEDGVIWSVFTFFATGGDLVGVVHLYDYCPDVIVVGD